MSEPEAFIGIANKDLASRFSGAFSLADVPSSTFHDGATLWEHIVAGLPAVVVVEWNLRKVSGLELLFRIRRRPRTKRSRVAIIAPDAIFASHLNALDPSPEHVILPTYNIDEIVGELWSPIRNHKNRLAALPLLTRGNLCLDPNSMRVRWNDREIRLSPDEFRLLRYLLEHQNTTIARAEVMENVWQGREVSERTVDVVIGRVRSAIAKVSGRQIIKTVRGQGYALPE